MDKETSQRIAKAVHEDLELRGISISEAAQMLGVSEEAVRLQLDFVPFNERTASNYSSTFGYDMDYLLTGEGTLTDKNASLPVDSDALTKSQRLEKIMEHLHFRTNVEFARFLGFSPQRSHSWIKRNVFDPELLIRKCPELSGDWLLTGKGEMLKKDRQAQGGSPEVEALIQIVAEQQEIASRSQRQADKMIDIMNAVLKLQK